MFVDYGSRAPVAAAARALVEQYAFCHYVYAETRGFVWNRAHALNIGVRRAASDFVATTDIDLVFAPDCLDVLMNATRDDRVVYSRVQYLPQAFADWDDLTTCGQRFPLSSPTGYGGLQCVATDVFHELRGFDEYYRYWGIEDSDYHLRLTTLRGLQETWISDRANIYHQWHPKDKDIHAVYPPRANRVPDDVWYRMLLHFERHRGTARRNSEQWGHVHTLDDRPVLNFLDLEHGQLIKNDRLVPLNYDAASNSYAARALSANFGKLPAGHAFVVPRARFPRQTPLVDRLLLMANKRLSRHGIEIDYSPNRMHSFLAGFILEEYGRSIADYFVDFPAEGGVSLIVKAGDDPLTPVG
ncbi:MAG: glycosyltransferase [Anaerolineae bacterium]|nr:glycosyltransferase [Anaerolineae bacterium]